MSKTEIEKVEKDNSDSSYQIYYFYVHIDLLMDCSFYMDTYGVSINVKPFCAFIAFSPKIVCMFYISFSAIKYIAATMPTFIIVKNINL